MKLKKNSQKNKRNKKKVMKFISNSDIKIYSTAEILSRILYFVYLEVVLH